VTAERPCVVILTGGAAPMSSGSADPHPADIELALEHAGVAGTMGPLDAALARRVAGAAFKAGWHRSAQLHRAVAVYVFDDGAEAARFARWLTGEVDPAHVMRARSPVGEMIIAADAAKAREEVPY
jgi:hypothetical protein